MPAMLIIWRNTPAGHPNCGGVNAPLQTRPTGAAGKKWEKYAEQNEVMRGLAKEFGMVYMDVDTPTSYRADGHHLLPDGTYDCHHYCAPGPIDHWVSLLHNVLLGSEKGQLKYRNTTRGGQR